MSALWGFTVGHEALKAVTQPDVRPTGKIKFRKRKSQQQAQLVMLSEKDILATVEARLQAKGKNFRPEKKPQAKNDQSSGKQTQAQNTQMASSNPLQPGFPITSQDRGVTLNVLSASYSGGALLLKVNFKNEGSKVVKFLYSFLDVTDDQGRTLSASAEGLPGELPPDGKTFSGTVSIPTFLLDDVKKLSLKLTDYPDQQIQLQMSGIPVEN